MQLARRNKYALEILKEVNELQVYPAKLLLLLEEYDKAPVKNKARAIQQITDLMESFKILRMEFEKTYGQTRIMGNPEGYQLDSNFHEHLANGTNNTDWMFLYELPVNKQIDEWLTPQKTKAF